MFLFSKIKNGLKTKQIQSAERNRKSIREQKQESRVLRNQRGQGLVEYLVIVALMGVATIAIVRTMGAAVSARFATVTEALQGSKQSYRVDIKKDQFKKKDLGNFFDGVEEGGSSSKKSGANYVGAE